MNKLHKTYLNCIYALVNVDGIFDHGADTQYGLMNYIAKFSLANDEYQISRLARSYLKGQEPYIRNKTIFPKNNTSEPERSFTFEHPIPSSVIRDLLRESSRSLDDVEKILLQTSYIVVLTQSENKLIKSEYRSKMPRGWVLGDDPYARYVDTPIQLDGVIKVRGAIVR